MISQFLQWCFPNKLLWEVKTERGIWALIMKASRTRRCHCQKDWVAPFIRHTHTRTHLSPNILPWFLFSYQRSPYNTVLLWKCKTMCISKLSIDSQYSSCYKEFCNSLFPALSYRQHFLVGDALSFRPKYDNNAAARWALLWWEITWTNLSI